MARGYKKIILNSAEHDIYIAHKCEMPTIVAF